MKISELVLQLEEMKRVHGDIEVGVNPPESGMIIPATAIELETEWFEPALAETYSLAVVIC